MRPRRPRLAVVPAPPVTVERRCHPAIWQTAMAYAGGDVGRIDVITYTRVVVRVDRLF